MIDAVKNFEKYVYIADVIGEYTKGKRKTSYFKMIEDTSYFMFREDGHDLNSEYGQVTHQYPNHNMQERITYVNENNGVLTFRVKLSIRIKLIENMILSLWYLEKNKY